MAKKFRTFDIFVLALKNLETQDREIFKWAKNRISLCHALALQIYKIFSQQEPEISVDLCPGTIKTDILVHNRKTCSRPLAVTCRTGYLTEEEQKALMKLAKASKSELVMAVSFFPARNYMLIYRAKESGIEYYHFDRNTLTCSAVRTKVSAHTKKDSDQPSLI